MLADSPPAGADEGDRLCDGCGRRRPAHEDAVADLKLCPASEPYAPVDSLPGADSGAVDVLRASRGLREFAVHARKPKAVQKNLAVGLKAVRLPATNEGDVQALD